MAKKYVVRLSEVERVELEAWVKTGRAAARKRLHAQILLKADEGEHGPAWTDAAIRQALDVSSRTVERVRQCLVEWLRALAAIPVSDWARDRLTLARQISKVHFDLLLPPG